MKLIILDHLKRWRWVLATILIAYFAFLTIFLRENDSHTSNDQTVAAIQQTIHSAHNVFIFQAIMWLGFLLMWDIQRGLPRVLMSLPLKSKQIGRAWWLASVAFPAIALGVVGVLAILIFSTGTNIIVLLQSYFMNWLLAALYLGAVFGALTFMTLKWPDTFIGKACASLTNSLFGLTIFGFIFVQLEFLTPIKTTLIFAAYAVLSIFGWFRAERMVLQRAGFRPAAQSSRGKPMQHKIPQGFGGLPYLMRGTFIQSTLIGLALMFFMILVMSFGSSGQDRPGAIVSMLKGGSIPYIFYILLISIVPLVFQLRFLRTLPISPTTLAVIFIFLPILSIAAVGAIVAIIASLFAGESLILPTANSFLLLGAKAAIMVSVVVWRGLDAVTYFLIFLLAIADSFIPLGLTIIFHLGSKTPEHPFWISLAIFLLCVFGSLATTQRLLIKSSTTYRVRTMPVNTWLWNMARR